MPGHDGKLAPLVQLFDTPPVFDFAKAGTRFYSAAATVAS
jgi:hypothetical protein